MSDIIRLVGENRAVEILGVKLVGFNAENAKKLVFTVVLVLIIVLIARGLNFSCAGSYAAAITNAFSFGPARRSTS